MERFKRVPTNAIIAKDTIENLPSAQPEKQHGRIFQEIVVEYPSFNTYPEYKGKPYFSIKYTENGQEFIGYGTYKPEVLSEYLKEYFMPSAQPEIAKRAEKSAQNVPNDNLISRKAAIDALMERFKRVPTNAIIAKDVIENLPPVQPYTAEEIDKMQQLESAQLEKAYELGRKSVQSEQRWIPCSEKLPEEGVKVLACLKDWQTGESKTVVSYRIDNNYWHGYGRYNEKCVAWMPLPEPYQGGE